MKNPPIWYVVCMNDCIGDGKYAMMAVEEKLCGETRETTKLPQPTRSRSAQVARLTFHQVTQAQPLHKKTIQSRIIFRSYFQDPISIGGSRRRAS